MDSHFHYDASHYPKPLHSVPVTSFFGSVSRIHQTPHINSTTGDDMDFQQNIPSADMQEDTTEERSVGASEAWGAAMEAVSDVAHGPVQLELGAVVSMHVYAGLLVLALAVGFVTGLKQQ